VRRAAAAGDVAELGRRLQTVVQPAALELRPELAPLGARLEGLRPAGWLMSGSGTSLFALCRDHREAWRIARGLSTGPEEETRPRVFIVRSCV
jgi:4-diphosphocytidyl-2-C-methyl-D-erythritol kinase